MPSIRDFSGGVVNQELLNKDNGGGVLLDCKNVLSSWNGELRKRTGTYFLKNLDNNVKIIPYRLPSGDDIMLLLQDGSIKAYHFVDEHKIEPYMITDSSTPVSFPTTGWTSNTNGDWTVSSSMGGNAYPAVNTGSLPATSIELRAAGSYFQFFNSTTPVVLTKLHVQFSTGFLNRPSREYKYSGGEQPVIQYSDDGTHWISVNTLVSNVDSYTSYGYPDSNFNRYNCYWFSLYDIEQTTETTGHKYWRVAFTTWTQDNYQNSFIIRNASFYSGVNVIPLEINDLPYTYTDLDNIKYAQNNQTLTLVCKGYQPYQIGIETGEWFNRYFTPSDYSTMWTILGYPACVTYYQNRLWFGGFDSFPTRVVGSEFGNFDHFAIPSTILATSPISADGTEISNRIDNLFGGTLALYALSEDGVSMIDAQGGIVATDQVEFKIRNREPAAAMTPTVKDDIMIYLGRDKKKILITDYDFIVQRFKAHNISTSYDNFLSSGIKELHYIPRKSALVYGILNNGNGFALLFNSDLNKNSLYPLDMKNFILDIEPIKYNEETKLVMVVRDETRQHILVEKLAQPDYEIMDFMSKTEKEDYTEEVLNSTVNYLDMGIKRTNELATDIITDIPYNVGDQITIIADGQYIGEKTVQVSEENGVHVQLDVPAVNVVMGYKYDSYAVLKFVSPYNMRKFPKEISVNFINSGYLEIGNTFDSLKSVLNNLAETVTIDNKQILMNGNYTKTLDKQTFETPYVIVRSDKGLPFMITGIDYKVDTSNYQGGI